jgi:crossover junction endodeoxyribonuclease RusA
MILELQFPPSLNSYYRHVVMPLKSGKGRSVTLLSKPGREYRESVVGVCRDIQEKMTGRLSVTLDLFPPDRRTRDVDNYAKSLLDSLTHAGIWGDDSQIDALHIYRREIERGGRVVVKIETIGDEERGIR